MTPTQIAAFTQLIAWGIDGSTHSYDDVAAQVAIVEGTPIWSETWEFTQDEIDNGIGSTAIFNYIFTAIAFKAYNLM